MSAYDRDPRVRLEGYAYIVADRWAVAETGQQWDAWPYPQCEDPTFDDQRYFREHLRGKGTQTVDEAIRSLIGDPR